MAVVYRLVPLCRYPSKWFSKWELIEWLGEGVMYAYGLSEEVP